MNGERLSYDQFKFVYFRYVVVTAKYKDGFTLFPSYHPKWNSVEIGPKKDIVRILSQSIKRHGMKFGVYYSLTEWFNKLFIDERENDNKKDFTTAYIDTIIMPEIKFLLDQYEPSVLWVDGDDDVRCSSYWKSTEMLAWIYNESPVKDEIVVNDRLSSCTRCLHGDFFSSANCYSKRYGKLIIRVYTRVRKFRGDSELVECI